MSPNPIMVVPGSIPKMIFSVVDKVLLIVSFSKTTSVLHFKRYQIEPRGVISVNSHS